MAGHGVDRTRRNKRVVTVTLKLRRDEAEALTAVAAIGDRAAGTAAREAIFGRPGDTANALATLRSRYEEEAQSLKDLSA